jgi:hypothetical protein
MMEKDRCDLCGRSLSPRDFEKGRAIILLKKAWCRHCMERMVEKGKNAAKRNSGAHKKPSESAAKRLPNSPTRLKSGQHTCGLYASESERGAQIAQCLLAGLQEGEKIIYAIDDTSGERVFGYLKKTGVPFEKHLRTGQLEIHPAANVYAPGGIFEPAEMISRIMILCEQAIKEGYKGLRGGGEMTWALRGWPGSEKLVEYELRLNSALSGVKCIALCQYDTRRFQASLLRNIRAAHSSVCGRTE